MTTKIARKNIAFTMLGVNAGIGALAFLFLQNGAHPPASERTVDGRRTAMTFISREMERSSGIEAETFSPSPVRMLSAKSPARIVADPEPTLAADVTAASVHSRYAVHTSASAPANVSGGGQRRLTGVAASRTAVAAGDKAVVLDDNVSDDGGLKTAAVTTERTVAVDVLSQRPVSVPVALQVDLPGETGNSGGASAALSPEQAASVAQVRDHFAQEVAAEYPDATSPEYRKKWQKHQPLADEQLMILVGTEAFNQLQVEAAQREYLATRK